MKPVATACDFRYCLHNLRLMQHFSTVLTSSQSQASNKRRSLVSVFLYKCRNSKKGACLKYDQNLTVMQLI